MKLGSKSLLTVLAFGLIASQVHADEFFSARLNIIHGINGLDLGAAKQLPVDIAVDGTCSLKGVTFGQTGAVHFTDSSALPHRVTIHPADGKCSKAAVLDKTFTLKTNTTSAVASLSSTGSPQLAVFANDSYASGKAVVVRHVAYAPAVYSRIRIPRFRPSAKVVKIENGGKDSYNRFARQLPYNISISSSPRKGELFTRRGTVTDKLGTWRVFYIVGSVKNGLSIIVENL